MTAPVRLESIRACLQGVIPSPLATCSADGIPNVTYLSIVHYVDSERVATSRQFFNKTRVNLEANPVAQVLIVDPGTGAQYALDLTYLHTETEGSVFEAMRANVDAVASQTGMGSVFRLRGADVHHVARCTPVGWIDPATAADQEDLLIAVARFSARLASCRSYEETTQIALDTLDDLFGFGHAILLALDGAARRLFAIASSGYPSSAVGAEVALGEGLIGIAAQRLRVVSDANVARSRTMAAAVARSQSSSSHEIPLPGLASARSAAAVPLLVGEHLLGVLYLESERAGAFGGDREYVLSIVGAHLAAALAARSGSTEEHGELERPTPPRATGAPLEVAYYQADDTVLCNGGYIVKGVPGRILWSLLRSHAASGRTQFTNRELRLDEALGLPTGNDNLEARLLVLRRRLDERACGVRLERVGRGRLELAVEGPMRLSEIPTEGPMRHAHERPVGNS